MAPKHDWEPTIARFKAILRTNEEVSRAEKSVEEECLSCTNFFSGTLGGES